MMKICKKCKIPKDETEFRLRYLPKQEKSYRTASCKKCERAYDLDYYHQIEKHTDMYKARQERRKKKFRETGHWKDWYKKGGRNRALKRKFGMTENDYKLMLKKQQGVCAICGNPETRIVNRSDNDKRLRPLSVDHDHITGTVRELLCDSCNNGIAKFGENIQYLAKAISYLEKHKRAEPAEQMAGV